VKLTDLEARWVSYTKDGLGKPETFQEAQGVFFLCPGCFVRKKGPIGVHALIIPFAGKGAPEKLLWQASGTNLSDLTIMPSIQVFPVPITKDTLPEFIDELCKGWHGFVTNGEIKTC
jgi:hypothetical protein